MEELLKEKENIPKNSEILVVIPTLNEERHLEGLVNKLLVSCIYDRMHIAIIDGGSKDNTKLIAKTLEQKYKNVTYHDNPKIIQAAAVNLAADVYSPGTIFLIRLDAHADYPDDYCNILVDEAVRTKADSVVVAMRTVGETPFQRAVAAVQNSFLGNGGSSHRCAGKDGCWVDHGHHALVKFESFRAVGGYDETFVQNEDAELDYRLIKAGYRIWLTRQTSITYYPRSSPRKLFKQYVGYGYGRARTSIKHGIAPKFRQFLPACVLPVILLALATPLLRWACLPCILWIASCFTYSGALARRTGDVPAVWLGGAALVMHAGWSIGFWGAVLMEPRSK